MFPSLDQTLDHQGDQKLHVYSSQEVFKHNTPQDCWLIIWDKVYNVTSWIPQHPGGSLIFVNAGKDSTQLFESYHPLYVRKMLARYCIGELKEPGVDECIKSFAIAYECAGKEDFYLTLKQRVETYFKEMKVNPRVHPHMFLKSFIIVAAYLLCYYLTFYWGQRFILSMPFAIATGFLAAQVGLSIQHDANHGAYSDRCWLGYIMSASLDCVGASSFMWRQQHVVGHHCFTNVNGYDPDIRVKDPDVRRVTPQQPKQKYHSYQHWYLALLYGLLALKSVFIDDFMAYSTRSIGSVRLSKMTSVESYIFWGGKLLYTLYMLVFPAIFSHHHIFGVACLYLVSQLVAGWILALMFQVAHVVEEATFPVVDLSSGVPKLSEGWAALQVRTSTNFCTDSFLWTHISGGLNFQIEHHLFPAVCHLHYPSIQPIVRQTCKEFNVPYTCFPSFWIALAAHFEYLKKVGRKGFELRLNG